MNIVASLKLDGIVRFRGRRGREVPSNIFRLPSDERLDCHGTGRRNAVMAVLAGHHHSMHRRHNGSRRW